MIPNTTNIGRNLLSKLVRWLGICAIAIGVFVLLLGVQIFFITGYPLSKSGFRDFICETIAYESSSAPVVEVRNARDGGTHSIFLFEPEAKIQAMLGEPQKTVVQRLYLIPVESRIYGDIKLIFFGGKLCKIEHLTGSTPVATN